MFKAILQIALALLTARCAAAGDSPPATLGDLGKARDVADVLEPIRHKHALPALAAAAVKKDATVALGAVGVRQLGDETRVTIDDQFHIGSCTKSMTATLCAILVQQGKLKWESTVGEVFADQRDKILPAYHGVTLEQLLTHRSGLPEDRVPDWTLWPKVRALDGPLMDQRRELIELVLARKPAEAPDTKLLYSNYGYTIAGAMCERVTGKPWEELMREHLIEPLGMTTAGFGPPGSADAVDQPRGHALWFGLVLQAVAPGATADNPAVIAPAGTLHCSLPDWAKYAALHVRAANGKDASVSAETCRQLHAPRGDEYACGWVVLERGWAGGKAIMHNGSNGMWYAVAWLAPERDMAFLAATNCGTQGAAIACDEAVSALIRLVVKDESTPRQ